MKILHKIDEFLFHLFGVENSSANKEILFDKIRDYYTLDDTAPEIAEKDGFVEVKFDAELMEEKAKFNQVINLCEKGDYKAAKAILDELLSRNKTNSEYYRIYGQILSDEGDHESAINHLIDALKWDPENSHALIMMGNVYARDLDDVETAQKYYTKTLEVDPKNHIAANNIAGNLMNQKKLKEARYYFDKALEINSSYPNTHYGLALIEHMEGNKLKAFDRLVLSLRHNKPDNQLFNEGIGLARQIAREIEDETDDDRFINTYVTKLKKGSGKDIRIIEDDHIETTAKLEIAEIYKRSHHTVKHRSNIPGKIAVILHELIHLHYINQARKEGTNKYFGIKKNGIEKFKQSLKKWIAGLRKKGYPRDAVENVIKQMYDGLNLQVYNAPIDLFIEDEIHNSQPEIRPIHFAAYFNNILQAINATTSKDAVNLFPGQFISKSKIYSLVGALHFKELYGADLTSLFKGTKKDISTAQSLYREFNDYRHDRKPGEEYDLVENWGNDLGLTPYFKLIEDTTSLTETETNSTGTDKGENSVDDLLKNIEDDPLNLEGDQSEIDSEMAKFIESQKELGINTAVVLYMVDALNYFKKLPKEKIREVAFEIAMNGRMGINPGEKGYKVTNIPGKEFTGYHLLAYYYVSWALAIPEMVSQLQMPYEKEYELALKVWDGAK